jgi:ribosomal protein S12 methylthiotransferase
MTKRIGLISLGCPKNLIDSEAMLGQLVEKGYSIAADPADSEIIIVNTCGFIEPAKKESIETILRAAEYKTKDPDKKLIVAGCLVQRYGKELKKEMPEVDHFVTLNDVERIVEACGTEFDERLDQQPAEYIYDGKVRRIITTPGSYAYLKIAEGCDHVCSFCAIPSMRGRYRHSGS